ncbi:MAG: TraB/VirB10 family protein [Legionellales bacterium]|jgi:conjugal transfer pilus assembly protein TraB
MLKKQKLDELKKFWTALPAQKRNAKIIIGLGGLLIIVLLFSGKDSPPNTTKNTQTPSLSTVNDAIEIQDAWLYRSQSRLEEQDQLIERMQNELEQLHTDKQSEIIETDELENLKAQLQALSEQVLEQEYQQVSLPEFDTNYVATPLAPPEPRIMVQTFVLEESSLSKTPDEYIPLGSFAEAILLNGLDASTASSASSNPLPVLLRLTSDAVLPRHFKGQMKTCHVVAGAYGELSTTRVMMRLETITCVNLKGEIFESVIEGYVTGDDGRVGVLGTLRDDTGPLLNKSFAAGLLGGLGQGISESTGSTSTSALGTVTTYDTNEIFKLGLGEGASSALDRLAQYYIERAEQIYPVIQVAPGRIITLVISGSQGLTRTKKTKMENEE